MDKTKDTDVPFWHFTPNNIQKFDRISDNCWIIIIDMSCCPVQEGDKVLFTPIEGLEYKGDIVDIKVFDVKRIELYIYV